MTPRHFFPCAVSLSGIYWEITGLPFDPGALLSKSLLFYFFYRLAESSSSKLHPEQCLILLYQCPITGPVAWQRGGPPISTTCTALKSKESALAARSRSSQGQREKQRERDRKRERDTGRVCGPMCRQLRPELESEAGPSGALLPREQCRRNEG